MNMNYKKVRLLVNPYGIFLNNKVDTRTRMKVTWGCRSIVADLTDQVRLFAYQETRLEIKLQSS